MAAPYPDLVKESFDKVLIEICYNSSVISPFLPVYYFAAGIFVFYFPNTPFWLYTLKRRINSCMVEVNKYRL